MFCQHTLQVYGLMASLARSQSGHPSDFVNSVSTGNLDCGDGEQYLCVCVCEATNIGAVCLRKASVLAALFPLTIMAKHHQTACEYKHYNESIRADKQLVQWLPIMSYVLLVDLHSSSDTP